MKSHRSIGLVVLSLALSGVAVGGCNSLLDNKPGTLDPKRGTSSNSTEPTGEQSPDLTTQPSGDEQTNPPSTDPASTCPDGQQACHGICVRDDDPNYGCGDPSCTPCPSAHGTAVCKDKTCAIQACDHGYADCNLAAADGCEVDLSKPATCGTCTTTCPANTPVCAPDGQTNHCATGCPLTAPLLCGAECVSPLSSVNHCGGCDTKCPEDQHGDVTCNVGKCAVTCKASYHLCTGKCVVDTDATACGPSCTVCPAAANATPTCQSNACSFTCNAGFGNCNANAVDGCEMNLLTDPLNCGACGRSCNGGPCNAGVCGPIPDAGP